MNSERSPFNPFFAEFGQDPYAHYDIVRQGPRAQYTALGNIVVHRYKECFELLRRPGMSVDERAAGFTRPNLLADDEGDEPPDWIRRSILFLDPPDHTRLRGLVSKAFTARRVEQLRERVRDRVDGLLDGVAQEVAEGAETVDLMSGFAFPLPFLVITSFLGMPEGNMAELRSLSRRLTLGLEPVLSPEQVRDVGDAEEEIAGHIRDAIEWKRREPADDLLTALVSAREEGERLTTEELIAEIVLLYLAGHETTVNLIGSGLVGLMDHRPQYELLVRDPSLDAGAVDELLRWDAPIQLSRRIALDEIDLGEVTAKPGENIVVLIGAANRDPEHWGETAGSIDLRRPDAGAHLSFGAGVHHCLGAALARLEGAEAVGAVVRRFPKMEPAGDGVRWMERVVLRGPEALHVALQP